MGRSRHGSENVVLWAESAPPVVAAWMVVTEKPAEKPQLWERFMTKDALALEAMHAQLMGWREPLGLSAYATSPLRALKASSHEHARHDISMSARASMADLPAPPFPPKVLVGDDALYECDVHQLLMYPIYWTGYVREVRRAIWFALGTNGKWTPCEMSLGRQIEEGYKKYMPWLYELPEEEASSAKSSDAELQARSASNSQLPTLPLSVTVPSPARNSGVAVTPNITPPSTPNNLTGSIPKKKFSMPDHKHPLLGENYLGQYVSFTSPSTGWILTESMPAKMAQTVITKLTSGENMGGTRLVRGFNNIPITKVEKEKMPTAKVTGSSLDQVQDSIFPTYARKAGSRSETVDADVKLTADTAITHDNENTDEGNLDAEIEHVLLVVHGQGIKQAFDTMSRTTSSVAAPLVSPLTRAPRIQVIPVQWRQQIKFAVAPSALGPTAQLMARSNNNSHPEEVLLTEKSAEVSKQTGKPPPEPGEVSAIYSQEGDSVLHFHYPQTPKDTRHSPLLGPSTTNLQPSQQSTTTHSNPPINNFLETEDDHKLPALDEIMLTGVPAIRTLVSDVVLDVLLYMTPRYRAEIITSVARELNRVYRLFLSRHPGFKGKVSVFGHSLGSVLAMEILCHQRDVKADKPKPSFMSEPVPEVDPIVEKQHAELNEDIVLSSDGVSFEQLCFEVDNFFCVGSPVGYFLLLQGERIRARLPHLHSRLLSKESNAARSWQDLPLHHGGTSNASVKRPKATNLFNMYHSCDPVAVRLEPLISRQFAAQPAYRIPYHKGGLKGIQQGVENMSTLVASRALDALKSGSDYFASMFTKTLPNEPVDVSNESQSIPHIKKHSSSTDDGIKRLNTRYQRVDFALQEGVLENPYLAALSIHISYWADLDIASFVAKEISKSVAEEKKNA